MTRNLRVGVLFVLLAVVGTRRAHANVTLTPNDVGNVIIGQTGTISASLADTAGNKVDLIITGMCTGPGTGTFAFDISSNIDLSSPVTVMLSYTPTTRGLRRCNVDVVKHSGGMFVDSFTIQGTGQTPPTISVSDPPAFTTVRFNDAAPVHTSSQNITVTNTGDAMMTCSSITIGGTDAGDFSITSGGTTNVTINGSNNTHTWAVQFNPSSAGAKSATMNFACDDPSLLPSGVKTINLSGTGSTGVISTTNSIDFLIVNAGNSKSNDITVSNIGTGTKGPLGVTQATIATVTGGSWFTFTSCNGTTGQTTCAFSPALAITNTAALVGITCSPPANANAGDMATASVTFTSDTDDAASNPDNVVMPLTCTAGKSVLTTTSGGNPVSSLAFNQIQVTMAAPNQVVTITNTGNVTASITFSLTQTTPTNFTISSACGLTTPCSVPQNGTVDVTLGFAPVVEGNLSATFQVSGAAVNPSLALGGEGIDRHIAMAPSQMFPDTFRYPGSSAMPVGVTIMNTGKAPLDVTGLLVADAPIWSLGQTSTTFTIPGLSQMDALVTFAPTSAGKQPQGRLVVSSNDRTVAMQTIMLLGNGKDRNVQMGPSVDIGDTGAGVPTKLSAVHDGQLLTITNMDPDNAFHIREFRVDDPSDPMNPSFEVLDLDGNTVHDVELPAATTKQFDVVFKPPAIGDYHAIINLYLDEDPTAQTTIPAQGRALFVDAHGGGGCSTGTNGNAGGLVLVLGLLLRRRLRSPVLARSSGPARGRRTAITLAVVALLIAVSAHADPTRNIELTVFDPTPTTAGSSLQVVTADVGGDGEYVATAMATVASNPLVLGTADSSDGVVKRQTMMSIGGAYAFLGRFEAGAHMPFYIQSGDAVQQGELGVPPASGAARGALTLHAKAQLVKTPILRLGLGVALRLPTESDSEFAGPDKPSGRVLALTTITPAPRLALLVNAGGVLRATAAFANIEQKSGLTWGAGFVLRVLYPLAITGEVFGDVIPGGYHAEPSAGSTMGPTSTLSTVEWLGGARWQATRQLSLGVAGGRGLTSGIGAPDLRAVFTIAYAPSAPALPSLRTVEKPRPLPPPIDPSHGDRDYDRIPDATDKCPDQPEDKDGFEDDDGCPDLDNDKDGVPDDKDKCPNEPEDKDGFQDDDGCPELDNDKDGIPDSKDKCPNEPETINGIDDDDGCPDKGDSLIVSSPERLELLDSVTYTGATITKKSGDVLGQLAATLRARTDIVRIRITVHVQPTASPEKDQQLSEKRAAAIKEWLVKWGIAEARLETRGFGGSKPLVPPSSKGAAAVNDRTEIIILELDRPGRRH